MSVIADDDFELHDDTGDSDGGEPVVEIPMKRHRGKPVDQIWKVFTDELDAHKITNGNHSICRNCKVSVRHHNKIKSVQTHLKRCQPFVSLMKDTLVSDRPDWWPISKQLKTSDSSQASQVTSCRQSSIPEFAVKTMTKKQQESFHEALGMHYFVTGSSFQRVECSYLEAALKKLNPSVVMPTRQKLAGVLLNRCYDKIKVEVDKILKSPATYVSIASDGWSNNSNEAVVNYMAVCPTNSLFIESVCTGEQGHDADWIASDLQRVMDSLGCNVVGAVTDNTTTNKKAWRILKAKNPTRFFIGCVSHGLHLMVKDIFSPTKTKRGGSEVATYPDLYPFEHLLNFATSCKEVVVYFHNHHVAKAKLKKALKEARLGSLVPPAATRWGSLLNCFRSLLNADTCLNAIVSHRDFDTTGTAKQKEQKLRIKDIITDIHFLTNLKVAIAILEPIDKLITKFQSDCVPVSDVVKAFKELPGLFGKIESISQVEKDYLNKLTNDRFQFMYGDAHGLGYILDPRYLGEGMEREFQMQCEDLLFAFGAATSIGTEQELFDRKEQMLKEYTSFRVSALQEKQTNSFRFQMLSRGSKTSLEYWLSDGVHWPNVQKIALKVFSMACSTASCERNFSTFGFIHSKIRNSLSEESVRKLVYVKTNALQLSGAVDDAIENYASTCDSQLDD